MKPSKLTPPTIVKKIGELPGTQSSYYLCNDGNIWLIGTSIKNRSNCGPQSEFNPENYRFKPV